jgi:DnaJ family protein C protein 13
VASKAGFGCFTTLPGFREKVGWKVAKALKRCDDGISHAAIDMLCALMEPMHQDYDLRQEQLNKSSLLRWGALLLTYYRLAHCLVPNLGEMFGQYGNLSSV